MNSNYRMTTPEKRHLPAEEGLWLFIIGDLFIFSLFFLLLMDYRNQDPLTFFESQATLNQYLGAVNTLLLLTSSWFMALALRSVRYNWLKEAGHLILAALVCGLGFAIVKVIEYGEKFNTDLVPGTDDFYMYYYMFTGVHLFHLLIGMVVLIFIWRKNRAVKLTRGFYNEKEIQFFEGGAIYWHLVDLLWIVLFTLIYLVK